MKEATAIDIAHLIFKLETLPDNVPGAKTLKSEIPILQKRLDELNNQILESIKINKMETKRELRTILDEMPKKLKEARRDIRIIDWECIDMKSNNGDDIKDEYKQKLSAIEDSITEYLEFFSKIRERTNQIQEN